MLMAGAQNASKSLPLRGSLIPGTCQKFLHLQDFYTMVWGDLFGVPLIAAVFFRLVTTGQVTAWQWVAFWGLAIVSPAIFLKMCLAENHKPDWGFPEAGKISLGGILHLPYFGAGIAMAALCLWHLATGNLYGTTLWVGLTGGGIYLSCFAADIISGNFDPIKRVNKE